MNSDTKHKPTIAVFKFASCDGCQLSLLDAEDELLGVAGAVDIAYFPEASRAMLKGPYDIGLVEGSITLVTMRSASKRCDGSARRWLPSARVRLQAASRHCVTGKMWMNSFA